MGKTKAPAQQLIDSLLDDASGRAHARETLQLEDDNGTQPRQANVTPLPAPPAHPPSDDNGRTMVLPQKSENTIDFAARRSEATASRSPVDRKTSTELRPREDVSLFGSSSKGSAQASSGPGLNSAEAALKQSENLRIAQTRITDLEREVERLRRENERLSSAGDALRRRADELLARAESAETETRETVKSREEEELVFRAQLSAKDREAAEGRAKIEELEHRLDVNFKKIRVREQQLEHRLEIARMENATLASAKDKMILDLKRQLDQLDHENEQAKAKSQEVYSQFRDKQEMSRKAVRAMRLALMMLEGADGSQDKQK